MTTFYITDRSGYGNFPLRVLEQFDSRDALSARMEQIAATSDDYDTDLNFLGSATHIASSEVRVAVGKCLPMDRTKASDIRTGPASPEGLPVIRAFAARLDRLREEPTPVLSPEEEEEVRRSMDEIEAEERAARRGRTRHGWR